MQTAQERREAYEGLCRIANGTLDWTRGQMKVRGYLGSGLNIRAANDAAESLMELLTAYGPEEIYAETPAGKSHQWFITGLIQRIRAAGESQ